MNDPFDIRRCRRVAQVDVASLISEPARYGDVARRDRRCQRQLYADEKLTLEYRKRLVTRDLFEVDRRRPDDLRDRRVRRRTHTQRGWNEQRIARFVALSVKAFRNTDLQRDAHRRPSVGRTFHERGHRRFRTRRLRASRYAAQEDERRNEEAFHIFRLRW